MDNNIKEAFARVKEDIFSLGNEIEKIKLGLSELKTEIKILTQFTDDLRVKMMNFDENAKFAQNQISKNDDFTNKTPSSTNISPSNKQTNQQTHEENSPTNQQTNPALDEIPTDKLLSQVLKRQKIAFSTGNEGVPTDKQTNQQTNQQTQNYSKNDNYSVQKSQITPQISSKSNYKEDKSINHLERVSEILGSLDSLKKEIRRKFKALTTQEILVFSSLYTLEDQQNQVDYKILATTLNLSESSIRDYIGKIQKKGIPIIKEKINNKLVVLKISPELKKIASLDTIIKLREL